MRLLISLPVFGGLATANLHGFHNRFNRAVKAVTQYDYVTTTVTADETVYVNQMGDVVRGTITLTTFDNDVIVDPTVFATALLSAPAVTATVTVDAYGSTISLGIDTSLQGPTWERVLTTAKATVPAVVQSEFYTLQMPAPTTLYSRIAPADVTLKYHPAEYNISGSSDTRYRAYGISYSPRYDNGSYKYDDAVNADISKLTRYGYIRSYGTDGNQAYTILKAVRNNGMKMMLGIWDLDNVAGNVQQIVDAVNANNDNWDSIVSIGIGNEHVNSGMKKPAEVVTAAKDARTRLRRAGYTGPIAIVDTFNQIINYPELCGADVSDYVAANCHGFFNSDLSAANAGAYVADMAKLVSQACGNMRTVITESGWPKQGDSNGNAVPSVENQKAAINSLVEHFDTDLVLFSGFDDKWKTDNQHTFNAEKFWGIEMS